MPTTGDYRLQAARIESVLAASKVAARVWQATVSHRFVRFDLTIPLGVRIGKVETLEDEIAFALGANAVSVYRSGGVLRVEVPLERPVNYTLPYAFGLVKGYPPYTALLGERTDGTPLLVALDSAEITHILIAGTTGSGKTVLLVGLLTTLAMTNHAGTLQFVLIDPKGVKLAPVAQFPHRWRGLGVISDPAETVTVLEAVVRENDRRKGRKGQLPRIVVAIDELADVIEHGGPRIVDALQSLTQSGREQAIHVVAATQRPAASLVGGMVKANFPARLLGKVTSTEDAKVAAGIGQTGAERLAGKGDFKLLAAGELLRFQSTYITAGEIAAIAGAVWANHRRSRGWSKFELEQVIANPIVLPEESATFAGVGELVTVTGDRTTGDAKSLPPAFFRLAPAVSPVTVTSAAGATAPAEGVSPADGLTPEQQLDALLPIGTYLRMVEPDAHDRALLRLAYQVKRTTNATMLRVYGRDQQGRIRKNSRTLAWLSAALAEGAALTQPEATPEESDSEVTQ